MADGSDASTLTKLKLSLNGTITPFDVTQCRPSGPLSESCRSRQRGCIPWKLITICMAIIDSKRRRPGCRTLASLSVGLAAIMSDIRCCGHNPILPVVQGTQLEPYIVATTCNTHTSQGEVAHTYGRKLVTRPPGYRPVGKSLRLVCDSTSRRCVRIQVCHWLKFCSTIYNEGGWPRAGPSAKHLMRLKYGGCDCLRHYVHLGPISKNNRRLSCFCFC